MQCAVHSAASLPAVPSVQSCTHVALSYATSPHKHLGGARCWPGRVETICLSCRMIFHYMRMVELLKLHHVPFNWRVAMSFVSGGSAALRWRSPATAGPRRLSAHGWPVLQCRNAIKVFLPFDFVKQQHLPGRRSTTRPMPSRTGTTRCGVHAVPAGGLQESPVPWLQSSACAPRKPP